MELIIIGFHIALVIGILLLIQAIKEKKKLQALEASKNQNTSGNSTSTNSVTSSVTNSSSASAITSEPVNEQKQAVQLVHDGLAHVVDHLAHAVEQAPHTEEEKSNLSLAEASAAATSQTHDSNGNGKVCPNCSEPWDKAFDFCIKCSHK